jgi:hypothetical protein
MGFTLKIYEERASVLKSIEDKDFTEYLDKLNMSSALMDSEKWII